MNNDASAEVHVLSDRDAGRIMAMLQALVSAVDELLEARKMPFDEPEMVEERERMFDEVESRLFEVDGTDKIF